MINHHNDTSLCLCVLLTGHQQVLDTDTAYVNVLTRGDLSSLRWIESPLKYFDSTDHPDQQLCAVHYTALNFRDIMLATGKLPPDAIPGMCYIADTVIFRVGTTHKLQTFLYLLLKAVVAPSLF